MKSNRQAKNDDGDPYSDFRDRGSNSGHTNGAGNRHRDHKTQRHEPQGAAAILCSQQPDSDQGLSEAVNVGRWAMQHAAYALVSAEIAPCLAEQAGYDAGLP